MPIPAGSEVGTTELAPWLDPTETDRLQQAEALVRGFCGWHIAPARTETLTVQGSDSSVLPLKSLHVTAVTSVVDDGVEVSASDYDWSPAGILTRVNGRWSTREARVTLTHGYDAAPAEVTGVVQAVAKRALDNPGSKARGQEGPFSENNSLTASGESAALGLLQSEKDILSRYRLPRLA